MTRIIDNEEIKFFDILPEFLDEAKAIDIAVGYFNLRGYSVISDAIERKEHLGKPLVRVLVGMSVDEESVFQDTYAIRSNKHLALEDVDDSVRDARTSSAIQGFLRQLSAGVPSSKDLETLDALRRHLREGKVVIQLYTRRPLHGKAYLLKLDSMAQPRVGFVGSSNLTLSGLTRNAELNVDVTDLDGTKKLCEWFDELWEDFWCVDVTSELLGLIEKSWATEDLVSPYELFLKLCYHLSLDAREASALYELPEDFDEVLLEYQKQAVRILARRVDRKGGAILGDVVGLGKTLTATAVAAVLAGNNPRFVSLILCPPNLRSMWESILSEYKINSRVVAYSMASQELDNLGHIDFIIADESHYLRNHKTRHYEAIARLIERDVPKVLLLSATPLNTKYKDLANQLGLYVDDDQDMGFEPEFALAANPHSFNGLAGRHRTFAAFRRSRHHMDWARLLGDHMVRRTRTYIRANFAERDARGEYLVFGSGEKFYFPKRTSHLVEHAFSDGDPAVIMAGAGTLAAIDALKLPRNNLSNYADLKTFQTDAELLILDRISNARGNLLGITRTGMYKRLSSGGFSFVISLRRHLARNRAWLYAIENNLDIPIGSSSSSELDEYDDIDERSTDGLDSMKVNDLIAKNAYLIVRETSRPDTIWLNTRHFTNALRVDLVKDTEIIQGLLESYGNWTFASDSKLQTLYRMLAKDFKGQKVLIFTEYKDTANYIYEGLKEFGITDLDVATSESKNPTVLAARFSPNSNQRLYESLGSNKSELNVLVTTDVLSEGQNLQDSHVVINFDLPWAIIKLIQRAGRVDRVGQKSSEIKVISFIHDSLDQIIGLRQRVRERLSNLAQVIGNDEVFLGDASELSTLEALNGGFLPDEDDNDSVDAVSRAFEVWNRIQNEDPGLAQRVVRLPNSVYATKSREPHHSADLIAYGQTSSKLNEFYAVNNQSESESELIRSVTDNEALDIFYCEPLTVPRPRRNDHFELLELAVGGMLESSPTAYGRLDYVRRVMIEKLSANGKKESLVVLDEMRQKALSSQAEKILRKAIRSGKSADYLEALMETLYTDGTLFLSGDSQQELQLIMSLGLA